MKTPEQLPKDPASFRGFVEGVQNLNDYFDTNDGQQLELAERNLSASIGNDPGFWPALYYKSIALNHSRKHRQAIELLQELLSKDTGYEAEVRYNLAYAYVKLYGYEEVKKAIDLLSEGEAIAKSRGETALVLLYRASRAFAFAVYGGRDLKSLEDFEQRKLTYLPRSVEIANAVLHDPSLSKIDYGTRRIIETECHNALGIAFMRIGQFSSSFPKLRDTAWDNALRHYEAALTVHPGDVRVLDNMSTHWLLHAAKAIRAGDSGTAKTFENLAAECARRAISRSPRDRFRQYRLAQAEFLLGNTDLALRIAEEARSYPKDAIRDEKIDALATSMKKGDVNAILVDYPTT